MICEQCNHFRNKCNYDKYCIEKEKVNAIYQQGRADAYIECMRIVSECVWKDSEMLEKMLEEQLKEQKE